MNSAFNAAKAIMAQDNAITKKNITAYITNNTFLPILIPFSSYSCYFYFLFLRFSFFFFRLFWFYLVLYFLTLFFVFYFSYFVFYLLLFFFYFNCPHFLPPQPGFPARQSRSGVVLGEVAVAKQLTEK